jgi:hypothetical protein
MRAHILAADGERARRIKCCRFICTRDFQAFYNSLCRSEDGARMSQAYLQTRERIRCILSTFCALWPQKGLYESCNIYA